MGIDKIVNIGSLGASDALGLTNSSAQEDAYGNAAEQQASSARKSLALKTRIYDEQKEMIEPWRVAGEKALIAIQETPDFSFTADMFEQFKDPSYDFRMQEGVNALDRSAASRGRLLSGAQDKAITSFGQNMASQEYGNAFNRAITTHGTNLQKKQSLAGVGQVASQQVQQAGNVFSKGASESTMDIGNAYAQGQIQAANAKQAQDQQLLQLATTAGTMAMFSDKRLKENIVKLGTQNGHNIYSWDWKDEQFAHLPTRGVIAQEVEEYAPEAITTENGYKAVNYSMIGL